MTIRFAASVKRPMVNHGDTNENKRQPRQNKFQITPKAGAALRLMNGQDAPPDKCGRLLVKEPVMAVGKDYITRWEAGSLQPP